MRLHLQEAVQEAAAVHCGHSEELPGFLLEEEVPAAPLGRAHLPEAPAGPAGPPGRRPPAGREEEEGGGGGAPQKDGGRDGEVTFVLVAPPTRLLINADVWLFLFVQRETETGGGATRQRGGKHHIFYFKV